VSFAVLPLWIYLTVLMIAPQLWVGPLIGLRPDLFVYGFWFLVVAFRGRLGEVFRFRTQDWFFVAMLVWMVLSWIKNGFRDYSSLILIEYTKWFVVYRLVAASIDSIENLRRAAWIFLSFGLLLAVEGIQHMNSPDGLGWAGQEFAWIDPSAKAMGLQNRTRWINIFDGPGVFCVVYTIALPIAMQYWDSAYGAVKRLIAAGLMVPLLGIGIVYTGSRGGMLTALAILGLYTLSKFHLSLTKLVLMLSIASAGMMLGPAYLTSTSDSSGSAQHRVEMWAEGIEMVSQNPILGIGKGYFLSYTNKLIAHNSAIEVMGETGFVGMFFWFGILYMGIRNIVSRVKESNSPSERSLLVGIGLSIVGYYVSSLFVTLEYETIYCLLGLSAAVAGWTVKSEPYSVRDFKIMISIMIGYFVLIKLFVMMYF
jgi:hypothetical protein